MNIHVIYLVATMVHTGSITGGPAQSGLNYTMTKQTCADSTNSSTTKQIYGNYNAKKSRLFFRDLTLHSIPPPPSPAESTYYTVIPDSRNRTYGPDITFSRGKWWLRGKYSIAIAGVEDLDNFHISVYKMSLDSDEETIADLVGTMWLDTQYLIADTSNNETESCNMRYQLITAEGSVSEVELEVRFGFEFSRLIFY